MYILAQRLLLQAVPVVVMIGLIPLVQNDYLLSILYGLIILTAFAIALNKRDFVFFLFGFCVLFCSEYIFIATGVETFARNSLLGVMPLWLPILWGYAFVAIRRSIVLLDAHMH